MGHIKPQACHLGPKAPSTTIKQSAECLKSRLMSRLAQHQYSPHTVLYPRH